MSYVYTQERDRLFTDEGQRMLLRVRDRAFNLIGIAGAATVGRIMDGITGDSFITLACIDRLVELGELVEYKPQAANNALSDVPTQHRVYKKA